MRKKAEEERIKAETERLKAEAKTKIYYLFIRSHGKIKINTKHLKDLKKNFDKFTVPEYMNVLKFTSSSNGSTNCGFFPYDNPKYAFVVIMEKGPVENLVGASSVMRQVLDYMAVNKPEYLK